MLAVADLEVRFGGVRPLAGVSIAFDQPLCGLVGPNGAGKTTLFNVVSGFVRPVRGTVRSDGTDLLALAPHRRARWGVRRTFQQEQVVAELSVGDNLALAADHLGGRADPHLLEFVGLDRPRRPAAALTLFERRKLELARALVGTPRVVLLDELGAGLSEEESRTLVRTVRAVPDRFGAQVVVIDHDMDLVSGICQSVAVLDFGTLVAVGPTDEVLRDERVRTAYLGTAP